MKDKECFRPELACWLGEKQHFACFTPVVLAVEQQLWNLPENELLAWEARQELLTAFAGRVEHLVGQVLQKKFRQQLNMGGLAAIFLPKNISPADRAKAAAAVYTELAGKLPELYTEYPRLKTLLDQAQGYFIYFVAEFLQNMARLRGKMAEEFWAGRICHKILHLQCDAGDSHQHGRVTMVVETDAGKCVYKPHNLLLDRHIQAFLAKHFSQLTMSPKAVMADDGALSGFCQFIENKPAATEQEAKVYYRNLGGLLAVFYVLGSTDYHEENILVHDLKPVPVDMETILSPQLGIEELGNEKLDQLEIDELWNEEQKQQDFSNLLYDSVFATGMDPCRLDGEEISPLHDVSENNPSCPVLQGQRRSVQGFEQELLAGFQAAYTYCLEQSDIIWSDLQVIRQDKLRVILQDTCAYRSLLFMTLRTGWLKEADVASRLQQVMLGGQTELPPQLAPYVQAEARAILRGDIPYYYMEAQGRDLWCEGTVVLEAWAQGSPLAAIKGRIGKLSPQDRELQCAILALMCRKALKKAEPVAAAQPQPVPPLEASKLTSTEIIDKASRPNTTRGIDTANSTDTTSITKLSMDRQLADLGESAVLSAEAKIILAEKLFEKICADAVADTAGRLHWFGVDKEMRSAAQQQTGCLLTSNGGLGLFFGALARLSEHSRIKAKASQLALEQFNQLCRMPKVIRQSSKICQAKQISSLPLQLGLGNGIAGSLVCLKLLGDYLEQPQAAQAACAQLLEAVEEYQVWQTDYTLWQGQAGLLWVICRYDAIWQLPVAQKMAAQLLNFLLQAQTATDPKLKELKLWQDMSLKRPLSGYARGQAGMGMALQAMAQRLEEQKIKSLGEKAALAAEQAIYFEHQLFLPEEAAWPSLTKSRFSRIPAYGLDGGTAGIGLAMLNCQGTWAEENLQKALSAVSKQGLLAMDNLAEGNCLAIELLLEAGLRFKQEEYIKQAEAIMSALVARGRVSGEYTYLPDAYEKLFLPGWLDGAAGLGYSLLRLAAPEQVAGALT